MKSNNAVTTSKCEACGHPNSLTTGLRIGQQITCEACEADLVVSELSPFQLKWVFTESEALSDTYGSDHDPEEWDL